jgi:hypothetical protein
VDIREYGLNFVPLKAAAAAAAMRRCAATIIPYALLSSILLFIVLHFILICFVHVVRRGARSDRTVLRRRENYHCIIVFSPTTSTSCYNIVINYINKSVGEVCR